MPSQPVPSLIHNVAEFFEAAESELLTPEAWADLRDRWGEDWMRNPPVPPDGLWMSRIPNDLRLTLNPLAQINALATAGAELRFNLTDGPARLTLCSTGDPCLAEVLFGEFQSQQVTILPTPTTIEVGAPEFRKRMRQLASEEGHTFDPDLVRVCLPWKPVCRFLGLEGEVALARPDQVPRLRGLFYGSSISHGYDSALPSQAYVPRIGMGLGVDIINLGFGGGAHLEPAIAAYIAGRTDWDFVHLEMGINIFDTVDESDFEQRVHHMVNTIHLAHPAKPLFCTDLFTNVRDWQEPDKSAAFRTIVADAVSRTGSDKVHHIDGREILRSRRSLTTDLVHPSTQGMEEMATHMIQRMEPVVQTL